MAEVATLLREQEIQYRQPFSNKCFDELEWDEMRRLLSQSFSLRAAGDQFMAPNDPCT
jgi:hypothetical protein